MGDIYFVDDGEMRAFLTPKVYMGREVCEPPTRKRVLSPFFHRTGRLLFVVSVAGDTSVIKKVVISHIIMIKSK